jgi:hypothetical protein
MTPSARSLHTNPFAPLSVPTAVRSGGASVTAGVGAKPTHKIIRNLIERVSKYEYALPPTSELAPKTLITPSTTARTFPRAPEEAADTESREVWRVVRIRPRDVFFTFFGPNNFQEIKIR